MHYANHYYGHAHVFARYVGLPFPPLIWGYLQHGWNLHNGFAVGTDFVPGVPRFVWSDAVLRRAWSMGDRNLEVIGSAWAYLLRVVPDSAGEGERAGTIFYPFHGWEGQEVVGDHERMAAHVLEVEEGPVTACLYWAEYDKPEIRDAYEAAGCRVISHGHRGFAYHGTDTRFLDKQLAELRRHRRVVSNRMSSAVLYGASVGCEVGIYGDPMLLEGEHSVYGGVERQARAWPELHQVHAPTDLAREVAHAELGLDEVRSPAEVMEAFGWTRP